MMRRNLILALIGQWRHDTLEQHESIISPLLQLRVLRLRLPVDGNLWVGIFPERKEVLVRGQRSDASGIGIGAARSLHLHCVRAGHAQMRQSSRPAVPDDAAVVEDLLELGCRFLALSRRQVRLPANVGWIQAGNLADEIDPPYSMGGTAL